MCTTNLIRLLNEKAALYEEAQRLRRRTRDGAGEDGAIPGAQPEDAHVLAVRILSKAQQTADRYVADAQRYSRQLAEDARRHRDQIIAEARSRAVAAARGGARGRHAGRYGGGFVEQATRWGGAPGA